MRDRGRDDASELSDPAPTASTVTRAASWMAAAQVLGQLTSLVSLLALGALVPPEAFGTVTTGVVLVTVATLLMGAGTLGMIVSAARLEEVDARRALVVNVVGGVALAGVIVLVAGPMARTFARGGDPNVLRVLSACLILYSVTIVPSALLQKRMRFRGYAGAMVASTVASSLVAVVAAVAGAGVWALVIRQVLYYAVLAAVCWWLVRDLFGRLRRLPALPEASPNRRAGPWFFLLSAADLVAFNADYLVVGRLAGASQLGIYALAFTLSFVPLRQFAWQVGGVLFAASAAVQDDRERVGRQMTRALRLSSVVLLPTVAPAVTLAPSVLPAVLGDEWRDMVVPFQILVCVGVGHALLNVIGEYLSGTGNVDLRARASVVWALGMVGALVVFVSAFGIRGAAVAHAMLFVPLATVYVVLGSRRLGLAPKSTVSSLRGVAPAVAAQAVVTGGTVLAVGWAGASAGTARMAGVVLGLAAVAALLLRLRPSPLAEALSVLSSALRRRATA